jgi:hypothetical protein
MFLMCLVCLCFPFGLGLPFIHSVCPCPYVSPLESLVLLPVFVLLLIALSYI